MLATKKQTTQPQSETSFLLRRKNANQPPRKTPVNPVWRQMALDIQPKLEVGRVDDPQEKEADEVAQRVMRMPEPRIQRKCAACEEMEGMDG